MISNFRRKIEVMKAETIALNRVRMRLESQRYIGGKIRVPADGIVGVDILHLETQGLAVPQVLNATLFFSLETEPPPLQKRRHRWRKRDARDDDMEIYQLGNVLWGLV